MSSPARLSVLYVCHGHPDLRAGGAEQYAWELFRAARAGGDLRPFFLARADTTGPSGPPVAYPKHPDCALLPLDMRTYDFFAHELRDATPYHRWLGLFVRRLRPDVVHFQHTYTLGYELIRLVKEWVPGVRVVYTLHDFHPICHNSGQMLTTRHREPCRDADPNRCHRCYPDLSAMSFLLRRRHMAACLGGVDLFVAPSRFLRDRYVDWGVPADRIRVEEYGRQPLPPIDDQRGERPRTRFAFFGQLNPFKGVDVLLRAAAKLAADGGPPVSVEVHGGNLEIQPLAFQETFRKWAADAGGAVRFRDGYTLAELPARMAEVDWVVVPSIWWENSPLVIQEAFQCGRPVLCSDIGGMAEKVADRVNGLHFRAGDSDALAAAMREAAGTPGLWEKLRAGIPTVHPMQKHLATLTGWYRELCTPAADATHTG